MINKDRLISKNKNNSKDMGAELILKFEAGHELVMKELKNETTTNKKYQEVKISNLDMISKGAQATLPLLTLNEISRMGSNGLFTATVNPEILSKLSDGTFSTIIRGKERIIKNAGFEKLDFSQVSTFLTINAAMQAMSLISGQYYLTQINSKLDEQTKLLNELISIKYSENDAVINSVIKKASRIMNKSMHESDDISDLRRALDDVDKIYEFYKGQARQAYENVQNLIKNKVEKDSTTKLTLTRIGISRKGTEREFAELLNNYNRLYSVVYDINRVSLYLMLVEIAVSLRLNKDSVIIDDLKNHFVVNYNRLFIQGEHKAKYLDLIREAGALENDEIGRGILKENYTTLKESLAKDELLEAGMEFLDNYHRERELLYVPRDDGVVRYFMEVVGFSENREDV